MYSEISLNKNRLDPITKQGDNNKQTTKIKHINSDET